MTESEFLKWAAIYRKLMMRDDEPHDFIFGWEMHLIDFSFEDAVKAAQTLITDARICEKGNPASFPQRQLPLILELCVVFRDKRNRQAEMDRFRREDAEWRKRASPLPDGFSFAEEARRRRSAKNGGAV